jgi:hypothetical protein
VAPDQWTYVKETANDIGFVRASALKPPERYVLGDDWD